jgi:hypothetical protein
MAGTITTKAKHGRGDMIVFQGSTIQQERHIQYNIPSTKHTAGIQNSQVNTEFCHYPWAYGYQASVMGILYLVPAPEQGRRR